MSKIPSIVILYDEPDRIREMTRCLEADLPGNDVVVFDNAPDMISWLKEYLPEAKLICLDHDSGAKPNAEWRSLRSGNGS